ncbi:MAG TPA: NADH-quinone oxidoreductase subunit N [Syntrophomonas sp.]|jgi:NADH-quinone oxidoreductase subunit N|nr:NADH-quinone oxidoreductase subunit N [Syntrophomonas sp.]
MPYQLLAPEILVALLGILILMAGLVLPGRGPKAAGLLSICGVLATLAVVIWQFNQEAVFFEGVYQVDSYSNFFKVLFLSAAVLIFAMAGRYTDLFGLRQSEWFSFMLFATLGMMVMASSGDLITLYVGLELMTISFYILSAYLLNDGLSAEAGLKYLILGALSSAVLLFGMSLIYASSGSTVFDQIYRALQPLPTTQPVLIAGIIMLIAGFGFKIALVPFHMWAPDIYQGSPTPVTAYLAVGSKAAAFAALLRVLLLALPVEHFNWTLLLAVLAAVTIVAGNLIALAQSNVKRLLAYSSIAQAGYILVGLSAANVYGFKGVLFYAMLYVFSNVGAFAVTTLVETQSGSSDMEAFSGLAKRAPMLAAVMTVCMLSLAGIPPMAGFAGKFYLFSGAIQSGYIWLAFVGLIMSMVSVYYYLNVSRVMYIGSNDGGETLAVPVMARLALLVCLAGTLLIGIYPEPLSHFAELAVQVLR